MPRSGDSGREKYKAEAVIMVMSSEQNDRLTRVGPGTPCGNMLRRYWWPIAFTEEVQKKPFRARLLGEDLVLFRDGGGRGDWVVRGAGGEAARMPRSGDMP